MSRIVIADDEPQVRKSLRNILREAGHQTEEAYDGVAAIDAVKSFRPNLLLLDWMLPELSGGEVLEKLRNDLDCEEFRELPVIVVSDFDDDASEVYFRRSGANAFVAKKGELDAMKESLLKCISQLV